jgi:putative transport protein
VSWWPSLLDGGSVSGALLVLSLVAAAGLALGAVRVGGISLGIAGVLFAGIAFGHLGVAVEPRILEFSREFGLVLFVYSIGMQVGPGFLASLRRHGLRLNLMAAAIVGLGVLLALLVHRLGGVEPAAAAGILSGATTNTPSLAAAQQALKEALSRDAAGAARVASLPGLGYAVTYPFGVVGVIVAMVAIRVAFRISVPQEREALARSQEAETPPLARANLEVTNPNLVGMSLEKVPLLDRSRIVVSRVYQDGVLQVPRPETRLGLRDVLLAVGPKEDLDDLRVVVGRESAVDLRALPTAITTQRLIVTRPGVTGRTLADLDFVHRFAVQVTRVSRAEVEMAAFPGFELQYGDTVLAVGEPDDIRKVATELGDSPRSLNYPHLAPMFVGIALGVALGSWPLTLPGVPAPVRLGLAGGPLLVAIALSRIGRIGPLVWYMPISANFMLREIGIVLFLCAVGLKAGEHFLETLVHGPGPQWMAFGAAITLVPPLVVGVAARAAWGLDYLTLCGLLAGSMTDPPALAFANAVTGSESPSLVYATIYPLTMILRVLSVQILLLVLTR